MKTKTARRLLAMALVLVMCLPLVTVPSFAADGVYYTNDFSEGNTSALTSVPAAGVTVENGALKLSSEWTANDRFFFNNSAINGEAVIDYSMDFAFSSGATNSDKFFLQLGASSGTYAYNYDPVEGWKATTENRTYGRQPNQTKGCFMSLAEVHADKIMYPNTGNGSCQKSGSYVMTPGKTYTIRLNIDLEKGVLRSYVKEAGSATETLDHESYLVAQMRYNGVWDSNHSYWLYNYVKNINILEKTFAVSAKGGMTGANTVSIDNVTVNAATRNTSDKVLNNSDSLTVTSGNTYMDHDIVDTDYMVLKMDVTIPTAGTLTLRSCYTGSAGLSFTHDTSDLFDTSAGSMLVLNQITSSGLQYGFVWTDATQSGYTTATAIDFTKADRKGKNVLTPGETYTLQYNVNLKDGTMDVYVDGVYDGSSQLMAQTSINPSGNDNGHNWKHYNTKGVVIFDDRLSFEPAGGATSSISNLSIIGTNTAPATPAIENNGLIESVDKASVRISDDYNTTGIRFASKLDTDKLQQLINVYGEDNVEIGTLITLEEYATAAGAATHAALSAEYPTIYSYVDVKNEIGQYYDMPGAAEGSYMAASLVKIKDTHLSSNLVGVGYVKVTYGTETLYIYADGHTANVNDIATAAVNDTSVNYSAAQLAALKQLAGIAE